MSLILHFDINGTITNYDSTEIGTDIEMSNLILAKNTFGTIVDDQWVMNEHPFNYQQGSISYCQYLRKHYYANYKKKHINLHKQENLASC